MISQLAKSTYEQWIKEGLCPSFQDIIDLNTVGVILEKNGNSSSFYSAPRMSFLGDLILSEPSIEKQIYIDKIRNIFANDDFSCLYALVYVLNTDFEGLPKIDNVKNITRTITRFSKDYLMKFTQRQIMSAVSFALHGYEEESLSKDYGEMKEMKDTIELPEQCISMAQMLLNKACGYGIDFESCKSCTVPQLERILTISSMRQGIDILNDENIEHTARFYQVSGKIHSRLVKEKQDKEKGNG